MEKGKYHPKSPLELRENASSISVMWKQSLWAIGHITACWPTEIFSLDFTGFFPGGDDTYPIPDRETDDPSRMTDPEEYWNA